MSAAVAQWRLVLDELRAGLEADRAAFDAGEIVEPRPFRRPVNLGELPVELADEAIILLDEQHALMAAIGERMAQLTPTQPRRSPNRTPGRFEIVA